MDRGGWQATVHEIAKESDTIEQINNNHNIYASYPESSFSPGLFSSRAIQSISLKLEAESSFIFHVALMSSSSHRQRR